VMGARAVWTDLDPGEVRIKPLRLRHVLKCTGVSKMARNIGTGALPRSGACLRDARRSARAVSRGDQRQSARLVAEEHRSVRRDAWVAAPARLFPRSSCPGARRRLRRAGQAEGFQAASAAPVGRVLGVLPALGLLGMEEFWQPRLADSREGTSWYHVLMLLVAYRLIDPGSEWRLHRSGTSAAPWGICSARAGARSEGHALPVLRPLLAHKDALQLYLKDRWQISSVPPLMCCCTT